MGAIALYLLWNYHETREASSASASASQVQGEATAYAVAGQSVESTDIPAGGELPIDDEGGGGISTSTLPINTSAPVITPIQIGAIAPTGVQT